MYWRPMKNFSQKKANQRFYCVFRHNRHQVLLQTRHFQTRQRPLMQIIKMWVPMTLWPRLWSFTWRTLSIKTKESHKSSISHLRSSNLSLREGTKSSYRTTRQTLGRSISHWIGVILPWRTTIRYSMYLKSNQENTQRASKPKKKASLKNHQAIKTIKWLKWRVRNFNRKDFLL
jgi:hypothetical protein